MPGENPKRNQNFILENIKAWIKKWVVENFRERTADKPASLENN